MILNATEFFLGAFPMMSFLRRPLSLVALLAVTASASAAEASGDANIVRRISSGSFPHVVRLLNWNVLKGEGAEAWAKDMKEISADRNLVTLQEGYETPFMNSTLQSLPGLSFYMAGSFVFRGYMTGVITGAASEPSRKDFRRSPHKEPGFNSPKMTGISYFKMNDTQELLVANLHGINFVGPEKFKAQLDDVGAELAKHSGPIILAGDFNTWSEPRVKILQNFVQALGLEKVKFPAIPGDKELDHVFYKGCVLEKAWNLPNITSSDHFPQLADLRCGNN